MAQFVQANQLSPIQGTAGQQQVVQQRGPTIGESISQASESIGGVIQTAGNIYGDNKAKSLVNEEIEEIDKAVAAAESGRFAPGDDVPESLKLDQKEWDMLSSAVQSGTMSRERARLIASSRLRSRIAEEPFFADRMRKAASGVLGFNIESEQARQYFGSFKTDAQIAAGGNDYRSKKMEEASAYVEAGIANNVDEAYRFLVRADAAQERKNLAAAEMEFGSINAQDFTSEFLAANHQSAWGNLLGNVKTFETTEGRPVDGVAFSRIIREEKQLVIEDFNDKWIKSGGQLNTPEYNRSREALDSQYKEMEDFVTEYGVDNLTKIEIERQQRAREMLGNEFFPQMRLVTQTFGQQVTSDLIGMLSMNESQRELLLSQNPELRTAFSMLQSDPKEFTKKMNAVSQKIMRGEELTEEDTPWVNAAASRLHKQGGKETKGSLIQGLSQGYPWKAISLLADSSPRLEPQENIETFKTQYENGIEPLLARFGQEITANPSLSWNVDDKGMVVVSQDSAAGAQTTTAPGGLVQDPQEVQSRIIAFNRAKQLADKVNSFAKAHGKGWSGVVGENLEQYKARINKLTQESIDNSITEFSNQGESRMIGLFESGDLDGARAQYEALRQRLPEQYEQTWDEVLAEARRLAAGEGGE